MWWDRVRVLVHLFAHTKVWFWCAHVSTPVFVCLCVWGVTLSTVFWWGIHPFVWVCVWRCVMPSTVFLCEHVSMPLFVCVCVCVCVCACILMHRCKCLIVWLHVSVYLCVSMGKKSRIQKRCKCFVKLFILFFITDNHLTLNQMKTGSQWRDTRDVFMFNNPHSPYWGYHSEESQRWGWALGVVGHLCSTSSERVQPVGVI